MLVVAPKKLIKALKELGFEQTRIKGSHYRFAHPDGRKTTVPVHDKEPVGAGLLNKIIKQDLKMSKKEFFKILQ